MATKAKNPYASIIGGNAVFAGVDQGIDFTGAGPVYALDKAQVESYTASRSRWPGQGAQLVYKLLSGPETGKSVYVSEDFRAASGIAQGTVVGKGGLLGFATGSGQAPGIETGFFNTATGSPEAPLLPKGSNYAAMGEPQGQNFLALVTGTAGVPGNTGPSSTGLYSPTTGLPLNPPAAGTGGTSGASAGGLVGDATSLFTGATSFFSWIGNTKNLIRVAEMGAGGVLILAGIIMLGRNAASSSPAQQTAGAVSAVTPSRRSAPPSRPRRPTPPTYRPPKRRSVAGAGTDGDRLRARPRRGQPGSSRLARGDEIPY